MRTMVHQLVAKMRINSRRRQQDRRDLLRLCLAVWVTFVFVLPPQTALAHPFSVTPIMPVNTQCFQPAPPGAGSIPSIADASHSQTPACTSGTCSGGGGGGSARGL